MRADSLLGWNIFVTNFTFGDLLGYDQSGLKNFKLADPVHHADLFEIAKKNIDFFTENKLDLDKYNLLLKIFDKAEIINNRD